MVHETRTRRGIATGWQCGPSSQGRRGHNHMARGTHSTGGRQVPGAKQRHTILPRMQGRCMVLDSKGQKVYVSPSVVFDSL